MKIVVLSFKIVPAARPSARPSARRPPVRPPPVRPSVRPPGPGPAEPIYIKLPIDRHGRLLLVYVLNACEVTSSSCHPIGVPQTKAHASYQSVIIQTQRNTNELRAQRVRGPKSSAQNIAQVCKVRHLTGGCKRQLQLEP